MVRGSGGSRLEGKAGTEEKIRRIGTELEVGGGGRGWGMWAVRGKGAENLLAIEVIFSRLSLRLLPTLTYTA
jgi:hypothetical protein